MVQALTHRGPDDEGFEIVARHRLYLGHRRLSIVDLAAPAQPLWDVNRRACISYNGEVYNHLELRRELESLGHRFATHTDTEVVLCAWLQWGAKILERMNGMFAFAIYDETASRLFLARDRFGKKPLCYHHRPGLFAFASELGALLKHPLCPSSIDAGSLRRYMAFNAIPAPHTILAGVKKLEPGCWLSLDLGRDALSGGRWYNFKFDIDTSLDFPTAVRQFGELHEAAVEKRLMSDVPLGVFLSGGLDSASVVQSLHARGHHPECFSIGFEDPSFDESEGARTTARAFGFKHHLKTFSDSDVESSIGRALSCLDEPMGDSSIVPTFLLCEFARESVTVALGGDGSDELLAGYDPFVALPITAMLGGVLKNGGARSLLRRMARMLPTRHSNMSVEFRLRRWLRAFEVNDPCWIAAWMAALDNAVFSNIFAEAPDQKQIFEQTLAALPPAHASGIGERGIQYYLNTYLPDSILCKVDRASMKVSLEVRAPFLDLDLTNFLQRVPYAMRFRFPKGKILLREHLSGKVPEGVLQRPKKGFGMPVARWLLGPLRERVEASLESGWLTELGFNPEPVRRLWDDHLRLREDQRAFLWNLLVLRDWHDRVLRA